MKSTSTVYVVDDEFSVGRSLSQLFRSIHLNVEVYETAEEFLEIPRLGRPCCLVLDLRMPAMSGSELLQTLKSRKISIPVIVLTAFADVATAVSMLHAGVLDLVEKPFQNQKLIDSVQAALRKDAESLSQESRRVDLEARLAKLTPGERDVLDGMLAGNGYKKIASDLGISYKTVQARRAQIMRKTKTEDLAGLINLCLSIAPPKIVA